MLSANLSFTSWDGMFLKQNDKYEMITIEIREEKRYACINLLSVNNQTIATRFTSDYVGSAQVLPVEYDI